MHKVFTYLIFAGIFVTVGGAAGFVIKRNFTAPIIDDGDINIDDYKADEKKLYERYLQNPNQSYTNAELINIGLEKYRRCHNSYSVTIGEASTIVNQTIRNAQIKNGDEYFEESISKSSMVSAALRVYQEEDDISVYKGKAQSVDAGNYKNETKFNPTDYKSKYGKTLNEMFIYVISNQTVIESESKKEVLDSGDIRISITLNPQIAGYYYKMQMKTIGGLDSYPTYEYLKQTYTFKSDMTLVHSSIDEKYKATMGVTATIHNKIENYYFADKYLKIPSVEETVDYSLKGEIDYE